MEKTKQPQKAKKFDLSKKNIQLIIAAVLGIIILIIYFSTLGGAGSSPDSKDTYAENLKLQLETVLNKIKGVSKVEAIITFKDNGSTIYAQDKNTVTETKTENGKPVEIVTDSSKVVLVGGKPLIERELLPEVMGVVIVCQGGGNPATRMEVIKATMTALSVKANIIEVFESNK